MALSAAELGWGATYLWVNDGGSVIWILPLGLAVATVLAASLTARGPARVPSSRHA
jgi:CubicO group peptidase (beta-lactamase class C family)